MRTHSAGLMAAMLAAAVRLQSTPPLSFNQGHAVQPPLGKRRRKLKGWQRQAREKGRRK